VVYEWGGVGTNTLVTAVVQSTPPSAIGPLGAVDPTSGAISRQYHAVLCSLAQNDSSEPPDLGDSARVVTPKSDPNFFGKGPSTAPAGVYLFAGKAATAFPPSAEQRPVRLIFSGSIDATEPISSVSVPLAANGAVRWTYRPRTDDYERSVQGVLQHDALTGKVVSTKNVVVLWARPAQSGSQSNSAVLSLVGQGQASVFRGGVRADGHWRATADAPPGFTADDGASIALAAGTTWFEVVPLSAVISLK
jgi:hypothetical protein